MNKKKKYLVIDVETANSMDDPLVYDIGLAVCDNSGKIYCTRSYIVKEIFFGEAQMMKSAYYAAKIPQYKEGILRGEYYVAPFLHIWDSIRRIMKLYNIKTVMAYNCSFDRKALNTTWLIIAALTARRLTQRFVSLRKAAIATSFLLKQNLIASGI